ncbi:pentatricopeptide repeat-containing protein At4g02750-like [Nymphaea colorata]|uniref:DYW domain-containing protein n=1 Tax=Nymphaea colorata TaxID=210225 RepID=A0A5K1FS76_9MAGN|nr:pentatricopeptide repeat-containing protein At4g02750-like [Nymphaea colorata]
MLRVGRLVRATLLFFRPQIPSLLAIPEKTHSFFVRVVSSSCLALENAYDWNAKITALARQSKVEEAWKVFEGMPQRDVVSWTSMMTAYLKDGNLPKARKLFDEMPQRNVVACSAMIDGYAKAGRMVEARRIFDEMRERNVFSWTSLIGGYLRIGQMDEAWRMFERTPNKNVVTWTTMILGYARNGRDDLARKLFDEMPEKNIVAWTAMISGYVMNGKIEDARQLFDKMPERNLYSWNTMISGYLCAKQVDDARKLFNTMPRRNVISWTAMITGLLENGMVADAREVFDRMTERDIAAWNAMLLGYSSDVIEAAKLFQLMPSKNLISWNTMINIYAKNGNHEEALNHLILMLHGNMRPNASTLTSVVIGRASIICIVQIHALAVLLGLDHETSLSNALITMYSKSGDLVASSIVFEKLRAKDVVSWTAMILGYSQHGDAKAALSHFSDMVQMGLKPDDITFVGVLSACAHSGLLHQGWMHFRSMKQTYGVEPKVEHYACMVDLLGRHGLIDEAEKLINEMPFKGDSAIWGALLAACKLHGNDEAAIRACQELNLLEASSSGSYVLLANTYASVGKWDEVAAVRKTMKDRGVKKEAGYSEIEIMSKIHTFFSGDRVHPEVEAIYGVMDLLIQHMKDICYMRHEWITSSEGDGEIFINPLC